MLLKDYTDFLEDVNPSFSSTSGFNLLQWRNSEKPSPMKLILVVFIVTQTRSFWNHEGKLIYWKMCGPSPKTNTDIHHSETFLQKKNQFRYINQNVSSFWSGIGNHWSVLQILGHKYYSWNEGRDHLPFSRNLWRFLVSKPLPLCYIIRAPKPLTL